MIDWEQLRHIHCIGIGGIGLSAIAAIFLSRGYEVTGSDMNQNDKIEELMAQGAGVFLGHREKNVLGADLVVYSAAVTPDASPTTTAWSTGRPRAAAARRTGSAPLISWVLMS